MAGQNTDQIAGWNGQSGERWVAVRAAFAPLLGERSVMIDGAAWIVIAHNPAG
ncbi:hypothetical protein L1274_005052 [Duganella sp. HSC-15S17]|uniref:Uncharacterized protein n=1 Tax=Duganella violaceipulchra TaxID=2849652 RepID=A0ABT1GUV6_9BURK|nr:hypothetical protein [Duganella violaceicalia]